MDADGGEGATGPALEHVAGDDGGADGQHQAQQVVRAPAGEVDAHDRAAPHQVGAADLEAGYRYLCLRWDGMRIEEGAMHHQPGIRDPREYLISSAFYLALIYISYFNI